MKILLPWLNPQIMYVFYLFIIHFWCQWDFDLSHSVTGKAPVSLYYAPELKTIKMLCSGCCSHWTWKQSGMNAWT